MTGTTSSRGSASAPPRRHYPPRRPRPPPRPPQELPGRHRPEPPLLQHPGDGEERRLGVQRVEDRLHHQEIGPAVQEPPGLLPVGLHQLLEGDAPVPRVVHIRGHGGGVVRGSQDPRHPAGAVRGGGSEGVRLLPGQPGRGHVDVVHIRLHPVVGHGHPGGGEGVGLQDVGARLQVGPVDGPDDVRAGDPQEVVVPLQRLRVVRPPLAPEVRLIQLVALDHGPHGPVQHQDAPGEGVSEEPHALAPGEGWGGGGGEGSVARGRGRGRRSGGGRGGGSSLGGGRRRGPRPRRCIAPGIESGIEGLERIERSGMRGPGGVQRTHVVGVPR
jgi:hypothetical protein